MRKLLSLMRQLNLTEVSGALGDLGTFLPLLIGLVVQSGLEFGTTLIGTGLYNIITGLQFEIPMPVQPMKTISAIALSEDSLTVTQICLAGIMVSTVVFFLGVTRLIVIISKLIPLCIVRGMQLGLGISLGRKGLVMALQDDDEDWAGIGKIIMGSLTIAFILVTTLPPKDENQVAVQSSQSQSPTLQQERPTENCCKRKGCFPTALLVVGFGLIYTLITHRDATSNLTIGPSMPRSIFPITREDVRIAAIRAALPQLPLTLLNSVVSVCKLSEDLFPEKPAGTAAVSVSVGLMNMVGGWVGVMPSCHGAGGLAAQVKFGARTGMAVVFLGVVKLVLGFFFGSSLFSLFQQFPSALLGAMLFFSGIELASAAKDQRGARNWLLVLITAVACLSKNTALGFLVGTIAFILTIVVDFVRFKLWERQSQDYKSVDSTNSSSSSEKQSAQC
eukprot:TRINITY_DN10426_c0_g2_i5.p1 TRINITY_DN10426_c0_g2~~TRINITY_DN10426_c0_g2_i5.p1  ORF type:complete len:447 (+),score=24.04 TRINITY_DN10426_c0_g2_i5:115-1455(+)